MSNKLQKCRAENDALCQRIEQTEEAKKCQQQLQEAIQQKAEIEKQLQTGKVECERMRKESRAENDALCQKIGQMKEAKKCQQQLQEAIQQKAEIEEQLQARKVEHKQTNKDLQESRATNDNSTAIKGGDFYHSQAA